MVVQKKKHKEERVIRGLNDHTVLLINWFCICIGCYLITNGVYCRSDVTIFKNEKDLEESFL